MTQAHEDQVAIAYVRAGYGERADDSTPASQEAAIREWCHERGLEAGQVFRDVDEPAGTKDAVGRPAFHRLLDRLPELRPHVVVVSSLDKWTRSLVVASESFQRMSAHGVRLASVADGEFDLPNMSGSIMLQLLAVFARYESATTKRRVPGERRPVAAEAASYTRFIILSEARTGSTMLAQALNTSPEIMCFREVFNFRPDEIDFSVEGYDNTSAEDFALRKRDTLTFLRERIFCEHPNKFQAVGFKFHYVHFWAFPELWDALPQDTELRVLHLTRRNMVRMLVSREIAKTTGVWQVEPARPVAPATAKSLEVRRKLTPAYFVLALRRPSRAAAWMRKLVARPQPQKKADRVSVTITEDDLRAFISITEANIASFDGLFREHAKLTLSYEDLLEGGANTFDQAQQFLGLEPAPLKVNLRRQNPEPLRDLLRNYDELAESFRNTPYAWMFE